MGIRHCRDVSALDVLVRNADRNLRGVLLDQVDANHSSSLDAVVHSHSGDSGEVTMMEFDEIDELIEEDESVGQLMLEIGGSVLKLVGHVILILAGFAGMYVVNGGSLSYENVVVFLLVIIYLQIVK